MKTLVLNPPDQQYWSLWQSKFIAYLMHNPRFIFLVASRQVGKTELCSRLMVHLAMNHPKRFPRFLVSYNTLDQAIKYIVNRFTQQLGSLPKEIFKIENTVSGAGKRLILNRTWLPHRSTVMIDFTGMGNASAIRGGSYDFYFGDEGNQYPEGVFFNIIKPMMSATMGTYIITGTVDSINQFYELGMLHAREQAKGNRKYLFYFEDVLTSAVFNREMIEDEYKAYEAIDDIEGFKNEYFNDVSAGASKVNPFIGKLATIERDSNPDMVNKQQLNIVLDRGMSRGNMPYTAWQYRNIDEKPNMLDYCRTSLPDLITTPRILANRYAQFEKINLVFPYDLVAPVFKAGYTERDVLMTAIHREGLQNKISVDVLGQVESGGRPSLIRLAVEDMDNWVFADNIPSVAQFLKDICKVGFDKNTETGYTDFKKVKKSKWLHVLDMWLHTHLSQKRYSCKYAKTLEEEPTDYKPFRLFEDVGGISGNEPIHQAGY